MENRTCTKCNHSFVLEQDDILFYEKMKVPAPKICPDCRFKLKALFRNETTLYSGQKCGLCLKSIVTMYNPKLPYTVYCYSCFYSDKWDPKSYAMEYDSSRSFVSQYKELLEKVPKIATYLSLGEGENVNSEYTNMVSGCKNCYLVFNTSIAEDTMYSRGGRNLLDCVDLYFGVNDERCYECVNVQQSSGVIWGQNAVGCVDSYFILNCSGLTNCFGCVNLRNKSHYFFNEQLSKEEYYAKVGEIFGSYEKMEEARKRFKEFSLKFPRRQNNNIKTVDSTGDYLFECKNVQYSFEATDSEDSRYVFASKALKDSLGTIGYGTRSEQLLEVVATSLSSNVIGTYGAENCRNIIWGFYTSNCQDCLGCDALKGSKYAILNKEYSKEEYESLKEKIIKELEDQDLYGLIMPPDLAPFSYNETVAQDNMPLSKEEALSQGLKWEDEIQMTTGKETISLEDVPDRVQDTDDSITKEVLSCKQCERNYKITPQEFVFYKKMNLPLPRRCFYCRHRNRIERRGPYTFWKRECANCRTEMTTNYAPERPETVYCESCYQKEVI